MADDQRIAAPDDARATPVHRGSWSRSHASRSAAFGALAIYLALAVFITWPFVLHPGSVILGPAGSDLTASITKFRELADAGRVPFLPGTIPQLDAPEGLRTEWTIDVASIPSSTVLWVGAATLGSVATHGLMTMLAYSGSAFAMLCLLRWAGVGAGGAFVGGLAFGFWPYAFSSQSVPFGHGWVLILLVWRALVLVERPGLRTALLAGLAAVFAVAWTPYWLLIGGVLCLALAIAALVVALVRRSLPRLLFGLIPPALLLVVYAGGIYVATSRGGFAGLPGRPVTDSISFSARPLMFVIPDPWNPLVGPWARQELAKHFSFSGIPDGRTAQSSPLYLGITVLLLATLGAFTGLSRLVRKRRGALAGRLGATLAAAALIAATGLLWSGPPQVSAGGLTVNLPMHYVNEITTTFRVTARFGVLVMLGLAIFVAVGVETLTVRLRGRADVVGVMLVAAVVGLDLWAMRTPRSERVVYPAVYRALRDQPRGIVAEYPLLPATFQGDNRAQFYRAASGYPLFNGYRPGSRSETRKLGLQNLRDPRVVARLAQLGVRYVVVQRLPRQSPLLPPERGTVRGLERITASRYGSLYRVVATS